MNKLKQRIQRFMYGRYGADELSRVLVGAALVCIILQIFTRGWGDTLLNILAWIVLIYGYFRMLSKNHTRRWMENQKYLSFKNRITGNINRQKGYAAQRKTHHIYKCPGCGQKIRIPKGKGRIEVTCPKCKTTFMKRS